MAFIDSYGIKRPADVKRNLKDARPLHWRALTIIHGTVKELLLNNSPLFCQKSNAGVAPLKERNLVVLLLTCFEKLNS